MLASLGWRSRSPWRCSTTREFDDRRRDYGERRIIAYGSVAGCVMVCVYMRRGTSEEPVRWIIGLRKARKDESHAYRTAFP
jgi:uncharacterized DUF497 family protein